MIDLKQTGPPVPYDTFGQEHDYLGTPKGWNNNSPGFQPGVKKKSQTRFGGIFDGEAENRDKT